MLTLIVILVSVVGAALVVRLGVPAWARPPHLTARQALARLIYPPGRRSDRPRRGPAG